MNVLILGYGRVGERLARQLNQETRDVALISRMRHRLTIIEQDERLLQRAKQEVNATVVHGDATKDEVLASASLGDQDVVAAVTSNTEVNLLAAVKAQRAGVGKVIARAANPEFLELFDELGITTVSPEVSVVERIRGLIEQPGIENLVQLATGPGVMMEVSVREAAPGAGKSVQELDLPEDVVMAALFRAGEFHAPRGHTVIEQGDEIVLVGKDEGVKRAEEIINGTAGD